MYLVKWTKQFSLCNIYSGRDMLKYKWPKSQSFQLFLKYLTHPNKINSLSCYVEALVLEDEGWKFSSNSNTTPES